MRDAFDRNGGDFEDDIQIACGAASGIGAIITRDPQGFAAAPIPVYDPASFVAQFEP